MPDKDINEKTLHFAERLVSVLVGGKFTPMLQFYMTGHCNLRCPGCYMAACPERPTDVLPSNDINHYMREFRELPRFNNAVCFSGGEIFTLPTQYLKYNIQNALDMGMSVELKTNGAWVNDAAHSRDVFEMISQLNVPRGYIATKEKMDNFLSGYSREYLRQLGKDAVKEMIDKRFGASALDMAISVDNLLHPAQSADWFMKIAQRITGDEKLAKKVDLKTFTFFESELFFENFLARNNIFAHNTYGKWRREFNINGQRIESVFGPFIDSGAIFDPECDADVGLPGNKLAFFFHPDRTVGFENQYLQSVGRVSYIDQNGAYKSVKTLITDIMLKIIADFKQKII